MMYKTVHLINILLKFLGSSYGFRLFVSKDSKCEVLVK